MVMYRIPLEAGAQSFSIMLGDNQYELTLVYRDCLYGPASRQKITQSPETK